LISTCWGVAKTPQRLAQPGTLVSVGEREYQKHDCRHAKERELIRFKVRMVNTLCFHGRSPTRRTIAIVVASDSTFFDGDQIGTEWYQNAVEARGAGMSGHF
jgi:hypothetical protein